MSEMVGEKGGAYTADGYLTATEGDSLDERRHLKYIIHIYYIAVIRIISYEVVRNIICKNTIIIEG